MHDLVSYQYPVRDTRGKIPNFLVLTDAVVYQPTGKAFLYTQDWLPAYTSAYQLYRKKSTK